jgi:DNA-binding transcriptional ArsR family regulator
MVQTSKREFDSAGLADALPLGLFKALCDPSRLAVLAELATCEPPCTVGRIAECCPTDVSVVSRHLAILRAAGVVDAHRRGKEVHYELSTSTLAETLRSVADAIEACCPDGNPKGCCATKPSKPRRFPDTL